MTERARWGGQARAGQGRQGRARHGQLYVKKGRGPAGTNRVGMRDRAGQDITF